MPTRDPSIWMWAQACDLLDRAERMQRQFFQLAVEANRRPSWQPPIDVFESAGTLWVQVALPGVRPDQVRLAFEDGTLIVVGERPLPNKARSGVIHRMELPHGRFERRIPLAPGRYEITEQSLDEGCLLLGLRKLG